MKFRHLARGAVAAAVLAAAGSASAGVVSVSALSGPWDPTNASNFAYGSGDQGAPTTVSVSAGATVTVQYQSGLTSAFGGAAPSVDALGYVGDVFGTGLGESETGSSGTFFPSYLISGAAGAPIYLNALIGDFVDSSGDVLAAFAPGDSLFSMVAPVGTVALQLGVNDDIFSDNSGSLNVLVTTGVPEPATWGLMLLGAAAVGGALRMSRRKSAAALA